jgi:hypothetical protein
MAISKPFAMIIKRRLNMRRMKVKRLLIVWGWGRFVSDGMVLT